ncbi:hypothetical protein SD71_09775 [Cohnella kolymensis]|uniref:Uncharacterized protein n=1 Tax=Cohnella kolymensis TaxID=1590652 RepID=A0ABR5A6N7_9BACL|nr:hypothetical protein [Cohnella kolymensis]KIL36220.1 hypothetical protein SD71_09775 [Cohnella kolymensis]
MLEDLKKVTSGIEELKVEGRSDLATYISQLKLQHAWNYSLIKVEYDKDFYKSAEEARRKDTNIVRLFGGEGDELRSFVESVEIDSFLESGVELQSVEELESFLDTVDALDTVLKDMTIYAIDLYVSAILEINMPS